MKRIEGSNPKLDGFRMPAEYEEHAGTYILWPERPDNWRNGAKPAQAAFVEVAKTIGKYENVTVGVSKEQFVNARNMLPDYVRVVEMSCNDSWIRDSGATFLVNDKGALRAVDWSFNSYGGLEGGIYFPWDQDDLIARKMCELEYADSYRLDNFVLEGGAIHVDGEGTCMVTAECLLCKDRNPDLSQEEIENILKDYLNVEKVLWVPKGLYCDEDTDGHIDNICNFVKPGEVILAWCDDENDPQYAISRENYDYLTSVTDAKGRKLKVHKMLCPSPITYTEEECQGIDFVEGTLPRVAGDRTAASYVNYYTGNGFVSLPIFNDPNDQKAIDLLKELYPGRTIEPIYAREILLGGGNIHCITQQVPKKIPRKK